MDEKFIARFWSKVERKGPTECWPWRGPRHHFGHGKSASRGPWQRAHRVAYTLCVGPVPEGLCVRHRCDNPPCCNPAHLEPGTLADNVADCVSRGRNRAPRGTENGHSKLTDSDVVAIRRSPRSVSNLTLATRYGVSLYSISVARNGVQWKHVSEPPAAKSERLIGMSGESAPSSKLPSWAVLFIRTNPLEMSNRDMAALLGIHPDHLGKIARGVYRRSG